ncbi:hypothetical protein [Bacillus marinisedimentorum]|uniref:hypothetical protein n=1 Tax=Bacillus marinisedimentorum TaxID=1821260 RepID=UPI0014718DCD|nr:hypothetical protein [Bacillus marinisedimentorum]
MSARKYFGEAATFKKIDKGSCIAVFACMLANLRVFFIEIVNSQLNITLSVNSF